ncbi:hypothetical protein Ae707Ps1_5827 [Pseudonocardia sp. Ae707_Ps1]|nr:hypothetical protein Ae707Ps1_5827 [Pseudonocardia sp. Ae707_Ps1]
MVSVLTRGPGGARPNGHAVAVRWSPCPLRSTRPASAHPRHGRGRRGPPANGSAAGANFLPVAPGEWRNGRRARFRSVCPKGREGSIPPRHHNFSPPVEILPPEGHRRHRAIGIHCHRSGVAHACRYRRRLAVTYSGTLRMVGHREHVRVRAGMPPPRTGCGGRRSRRDPATAGAPGRPVPSAGGPSDQRGGLVPAAGHRRAGRHRLRRAVPVRRGTRGPGARPAAGAAPIRCRPGPSAPAPRGAGPARPATRRGTWRDRSGRTPGGTDAGRRKSSASTASASRPRSRSRPATTRASSTGPVGGGPSTTTRSRPGTAVIRSARWAASPSRSVGRNPPATRPPSAGARRVRRRH